MNDYYLNDFSSLINIVSYDINDFLDELFTITETNNKNKDLTFGTINNFNLI